MNKIHFYDWNKLMEIVKFIEHEADFHPKWTVNYRVKIQSEYCTIDIGENTLGVDGTFWVAKDSKIEAVAICLESFLIWYSQFGKLTPSMRSAISK